MTDLIKVDYSTDNPTVSGRELHEKLGVETRYTQWFDRMTEYGFAEGTDFVTCFPNLGSESHGGQNKADHALTLDMAKEIAMIQRTPQGKLARRYFIEVEKAWRSGAQHQAIDWSPDRRIQIAEFLQKHNPPSPYALKILGLAPDKTQHKPKSAPGDLTIQQNTPRPALDEHRVVEDFLAQIGDCAGMPTLGVYEAYADYCKRIGTNPLSHFNFSKQITKLIGGATKTSRINGKVCRVFVKKGRH